MGAAVPLTLHADELVELAWWWEEPPAGRLLELRDIAMVRGLLGRWCGRAMGAGALRGFVARGEAHEVARFENGELFEQVATAIVRGRIRVGVAAREALIAWDGEEEEVPLGERVVVEKVEQEEEIAIDECLPCKMAREAKNAAEGPTIAAMTSARALREAAKHGTPFVADW